MRIGRCLPPAAAPISIRDLFSGLQGLCKGKTEVARFNKELQEYFGAKHSFLVSSGKTALTAILQALKEISPDRKEVLIPAFTCYSVPSAIVRAGLEIRLCDLDPETYDFDYDQLSTILSHGKENLLCIVPVHLFGIPSNIERLRSLIDDSAVFIVEDAAQAMGGDQDGKKLGMLGDVGFFSLGRGKALSTIEGGVILTNRREIAEQIETVLENIPNYGVIGISKLILYSMALLTLLKPFLFWLPKALPFLRLGETIYDPYFKMRKMSPFQAGLARGWEKKLLRFKMKRAENLRDLLCRLGKIDICTTWASCAGFPSLLRCPLRMDSVDDRDSLLRMSDRLGLGITGSYPGSVDGLPGLNIVSAPRHYTVANENAEKLVTLPIHPYVTKKDNRNVAKLLAQVKRS